MPVRNGVLAKSVSAGAGVVTLATVGLSETYLVKSIVLFNNGGAPVATNVFAIDPVSGAIGAIFNQTVAAGGFYQWSGLIALGPGHQLDWNPAAAAQHIWVTGADLPGHL